MQTVTSVLIDVENRKNIILIHRLFLWFSLQEVMNLLKMNQNSKATSLLFEHLRKKEEHRNNVL